MFGGQLDRIEVDLTRTRPLYDTRSKQGWTD